MQTSVVRGKVPWEVWPKLSLLVANCGFVANYIKKNIEVSEGEQDAVDVGV